MNKYIPTIGLEIHAELKTKTKMFCDCLNDSQEQHPNHNTCPICLGHPGALPVINQSAVESILMIGIAVQGDLPQFSKFDRKNYFYPDLPKGYQISQYDLPLVFGGFIKDVRLTRIHLEEDAGRLQHETSDKGQGSSLVDFNRAGVPLMELVTEPDIKNSNQAVEFAKELQLILRYLGVSDADMEKGQLRVEVNISLSLNSDTDNRGNDNSRINAESESDSPRTSAPSPRKSATLGTKVEVKNINSFKAVHDAIEFEIARQTEVLENGKKVVQETRGWDDVKKITFSQRLKEQAQDYRYFPEPDLPPLNLNKLDLKAIKLRIPELPQAKRARFVKEFVLKPEQAEILVVDREMANYFEQSVSELEGEEQGDSAKEVQLIFNYLASDLRGLMTEFGIAFADLKITPENFADLVELISQNKISSRSAKDILRKMQATGEDPNNILQTEGLHQVSNTGALGDIVKKIIATNPNAVADYKKGKQNSIQFLIGQAMKELRGKGNPEILQKLFKDKLN